MKEKEKMKAQRSAVQTLEVQTPVHQSQARVCMHVLGPLEIDVRVEREAHTLLEYGYQVTVVDLARKDTRSLVEVHQGLQVKHISVSRRFAATRFQRWPFLRAVPLFTRAVLTLLRTPADIYHAHDFQALPATYVAARLKHKPLIYDAHELPLTELSIKSRWLEALLKAVVQHIVPRCAGVISVSPPILEQIQQEYHASTLALVRNIPYYQSIPRNNRLREHLGVSAETRLFLYQGYLAENRGLDLLVRAARFLRPQAMIILLGPPRPAVLAELTALIASEGVSERVKILPAVPYTELLHWTASADVGLALFRPDYSLNIRWCLPNKLFEYIMAGLPVLSTPLDAVREVLETRQVGRVVADLTPEGIASAMNELLADPVALAEMRRRTLLLAREELCWEKEREALLRLYAQVDLSART